MRRWYEASQHRFSVRKYKAAPEETQLQALAGMADLLCAHGVRIAIGRAEQVFKPIFLWYGKIRGTDAFAAVVLDAAAEPEMAGYVGEAFVLECTAMGLGTCWLGASYNKNNAFSAIKLAEGERVACIIAIGVPDEAYVARPRRSFEKLTGLTADAFGALPTWQKRAIECARRAPSAPRKMVSLWKIHPPTSATGNWIAGSQCFISNLARHTAVFLASGEKGMEQHFLWNASGKHSYEHKI